MRKCAASEMIRPPLGRFGTDRSPSPRGGKSWLFSWTRHWIQRIRTAFDRLASLKDDPRQIASGFALGLFVGMSPYMMCHTITAVFLASLFKWNRLSAAAGVFITNPVTAPILYRITYLVGRRFVPDGGAHHLPTAFSVDAVMEILKGAPEMLWILTIGGVVTGIPIAVFGYYLAYWGISRYRRRKGAETECAR